jgi:putative transmembrane protein PGPGW
MAAERTDDDRPVDAALGGQRPVRPGSFRDRVRRRPVLGRLWRAGVFLAGLACIAAGGALVVLPGPLTIPPIVLGLWIWSTEFEWAHRLFAKGREKGLEAWRQARRHPVSSTVVTGGGLVLAGAVIWAVLHFDLVARAEDAVGLS